LRSPFERRAELKELTEVNRNFIEHFPEDPAIDNPQMISKLLSMEEIAMLLLGDREPRVSE
jgi:hypothetical protein